jgi:predicted dehydrogenase
LKKRVAIIGMGPMGRRHLQAVSKVAEAELVAVADGRAEALASADLNGARPFSDAQRMLDEVHPDVVIVSTNGPSHHPLVLAAIAAGARGILCEKPMACSVAEAEEMSSRARESGCALAVNHWRRHMPAYQWMANHLQSGAWGELRSMRCGLPGIGLGCTATHIVDLFRFLGGEELDTVFGWVDPVRGSNPRGSQFSDPGGMIVATSSRGTRYIHDQIEDGAGPGTLIIETTGALVRVDESSRSVNILARDLSVKPGPGRPPKHDPVPLPGDCPLDLDIIGLTAKTLSELCLGGEPTCAAEHGLRSLEVVVATHISSDRGHAPVALPLDGEAKTKWLPIT